MKTILCAAVAVAAMSVGVASSQAAFVSVDSYQQPRMTVTVDATTPANSVLEAVPLTTAVGGTRLVQLTRVAAGVGNDDTDGAKVRVGGTVNSLAFASDPGILGSLQLSYGSSSPLNLNMTGMDGLLLGFVSVDQPLTFDVSIMSASNPSTSTGYSVAAGDHTVSIPFTDFSGLTLSDVDQITYTFHPLTGGDFILVEPLGSHVPEPASLGLLGLGAAALLRRRSR